MIIELTAAYSVVLVVLSFVFYKKYSAKSDENQLLIKYLQDYKTDNEQLESAKKNDEDKIDNLTDELYEQKILNSKLQTKIEMQEENKEKLKVEFKNIANVIFENSNRNLSEHNKENMSLILNPMKQQLNDFKQKVEDVHIKDTTARGELNNELKNLKDLNRKISQDAINLTNALKGQSKQQGIWGEMVLEKVLESSGLRLGEEYKKEVSLKDEEGKVYRPDVVVNLPQNRDIIIDAKTSLNAYSEYISQEQHEQKEIFLKKHISAIKDHIKILANKNYENLQGVNSLDFIFMFVPIEQALYLALDNDTHLYDEAFKQKIILVSPSSLLVTLRAIENSWRYEKQAKNINEVSKRAEMLYVKFTNFVADIEDIGQSLQKVNSSYENCFKKLSTGDGNLIWQATKLKEVSNIKPKKEVS